MRIEAIGNTGFAATLAGGKTLLLDCWLSDDAFHGAWGAYPVADDALRHRLARDPAPDFVFVSHLHDDHFDAAFLSLLAPETPILIAKRRTPHLLRRLEALGLTNVIELAPEQETAIDGIDFTVFDDFAVDPEAPADGVGYQLDSSLLLRDGDGVAFLHVNDNIPSEAQARRLKEKIGPLDAAAMVVAAASSYPHCFDNFADSEKLAKRGVVMEKSRARFFTAMAALAPRAAIACGNYVLNGPLAALDRFAPVPTADFVAEDAARLPKQSALVMLNRGDALLVDKHDARVERSRAITPPRADEAARAAARKLHHELATIPPSFAPPWPRLLAKARANLWKMQEKLRLTPDWIVVLRPETLGEAQPGNALLTDAPTFVFDLKTAELPASAGQGRNVIEFGIDPRLLFLLLTGCAVWDNVYTASLVRTRRTPDVFDMNVTKLMSFFAL